MLFNLIDIFTQFASILGGILSSFTTTRDVLETTVSNVQAYDYLTLIAPYVGTIRYVVGDYIFNLTIRIAQIGIFIGIAKAAYQLIHMLTSSVLIQKPFQLIKSFVGL